MCLYNVSDTKTRKRTGYKVFIADEYLLGVLRSSHQGAKRGMLMDVWQCEREHRTDTYEDIIADSCESYPYGFHILLSLKDVRHWSKGMSSMSRIHRVRFRKVVACGDQRPLYPNPTSDDLELMPCVVAQEMMILEEVTS